MTTPFPNPKGAALLALLLLAQVPAFAQGKPPESASKVKKVLLYNKIGGWVHVNGSQRVKEAMVKLAATKGFELTQSTDPDFLTAENLKQFQVIVWNNNTSAGNSVPSVPARDAVVEYVRQGGGWLLIHGASWGLDTWPELLDLMGTQFSHHAGPGFGEFVLDREARAHPELKWMVDGYPEILTFEEEWDAFKRNVRGLPGLTLIATARNLPGATNLTPALDETGEWPVAWAREVGQGRLIFNSLGHGQYDLMAQNDSLLPRMYWENIRYAAGDFQNGCTHPADSRFEPAARIHVDSLCASAGLGVLSQPPRLAAGWDGRRIRLSPPSRGALTARVWNLRGMKVWERILPAGTGEIVLDQAVGPGLHHLEIVDGHRAFRHRLAIP